MGTTTTIVLILIMIGLLTLAIWLARALASYPRDPAAHGPGAVVERDLSGRATPPKLGWNWGAFFLGPIWYLFQGLWVYTIILTCLLAILMLVLRPGRFFLPRKPEPKVRTKYVDAWAEAGQRMEVPEEEGCDAGDRTDQAGTDCEGIPENLTR